MNNSSKISTTTTKINIKLCVGILWACIFPILNLVGHFVSAYHPISKHPFEKDIFIISSYVIIISWSILCVWASCRLINEFPLWVDALVVVIGGIIYIRHLIDWRISYKESLETFLC